MKRKSIEEAIAKLKFNLDTVARVYEWAELMGYENTKLFSRHFFRHFKCRPSEALTEIRLLSIIEMLHKNNKSCAEIAWAFSLPDEKALNSYLNRHLDCSPTQIREMSDQEVQVLMNREVR